jgi:carboxymethylenebutenolidase
MKKWFVRGILAIVGVIVLLILGVVGVIAWDGQFGAKASDFTNMTFESADGTAIDGYLAQPEGEGPFPAVLMVHEWWGMNAEITEMADILAEQGYVVLAPDTYRGNTTSLIPRAVYLRVTVPEARVDADMQAAFDYLSQLPQVDATRVGLIGFCYGGGVVLRHAIQNSAIAATVTLYGDTYSDPAELGALLAEDAGPVLGIYGGQDAQIPVEEVRVFENTLQQAGIEHTITVYDAMGHAFVHPSVLEAEGDPRTAWLQILEFFSINLQQAESASS